MSHGFEHGGLQGAALGGAGAAAAYMVNSLRQAGIKRTSDLYMAALADPELARTLISKMPTKAGQRDHDRLLASAEAKPSAWADGGGGAEGESRVGAIRDGEVWEYTSPTIVRFSPQLRVAPKWESPTSALNALLSADTTSPNFTRLDIVRSPVAGRLNDMG